MIAELRNDVPCIDVTKASWPTFQNNLIVTLGVPALLIFVPTLLVIVPVCVAAFVVLGGAAMMHKSDAMIGLIPVIAFGMLVFAVIYNAIRVGWTKILLSLAQGETAKFSDVFSGKRWFVNFLVVNFIIGIGTFIGGMIFVVPGVFFAVRTAMAPFLVVDRNMGPIEALVASNEMVTGYSWQILIYLLLYFVANLVAGFIPIVGGFMSVPILGFFDIVLAKLYLMRKLGTHEALVVNPVISPPDVAPPLG